MQNLIAALIIAATVGMVAYTFYLYPPQPSAEPVTELRK